MLGGWTYINDGVSSEEHQLYEGGRIGWLVRDLQKIAASTAIENVLMDYINIFDYWINRFTKTRFLNVSTEEWARVYPLDMADEQAVANMTIRLRKIRMGE